MISTIIRCSDLELIIIMFRTRADTETITTNTRHYVLPTTTYIMLSGLDPILVKYYTNLSSVFVNSEKYKFAFQ